MPRHDVMSEIFPSFGENSHLMQSIRSRGSNRAARHLLVDWKWCANRATGGEA
jgi:hypothetical protein